MILFPFASYEGLARQLADIFQHGAFSIRKHPNGELFSRIEGDVHGESCCILGSIAPPADDLLSVLLLAHTLKKEGASTVSALLPYLAYARHDKGKQGESLAIQLIGQLMQTSGIDRVICVDMHSVRDQHLVPIPIISLSPAKIFAEMLREFDLSRTTLVAPDEGALKRCEDVRASANMQQPVAYFKKHRDEKGITLEGPVGDVEKSVVLIDDILDTGGTLTGACERLKAAGTEEMTVMVTHGLFTGSEWQGLWNLGVKHIYCTDTIPVALSDSRISHLSIVSSLRIFFRAHNAVSENCAQRPQKDNFYEFLEHTGDIKMHVSGSGLSRLFIAAAEGMTEYLFGKDILKDHSLTETIALSSPDRESLLVDWLSEILYRSTIGRRAYMDFNVNDISEVSISATAISYPAIAKDDIKAVTYHDLRIEEKNGVWCADIVFDV